MNMYQNFNFKPRHIFLNCFYVFRVKSGFMHLLSLPIEKKCSGFEFWARLSDTKS